MVVYYCTVAPPKFQKIPLHQGATRNKSLAAHTLIHISGPIVDRPTRDVPLCVLLVLLLQIQNILHDDDDD